MVPLQIGLLWHSANSGNLGVGALTVANLSLVREVAAELAIEPRFVIIGMGDEGPRYVNDPDVRVFDVNTRALVSPNGCWSVLGDQSCVVDIGGGDSFADIYGAKRFGFLWLTKAITLLRGVPLVLAPQTIGPFTREPYRTLARLVMEKAAVVVARDRQSLEFLGEIAPKATAALAADVAFALPYEDRRAIRGGERLRVGVNVSGLLFREAEKGGNRFGLGFDYARLMRMFIEALQRMPNVEVHLVAHVNGDGVNDDDDGPTADALAVEYPGVLRVPDFAGPTDAKSYISSLDFLVGARMHACIAAFSSGVPVAPIAYSRKFSGLFGMLGYEWMVPVAGKDTEEALATLLDCLERRETLAADIATGMADVDSLLQNYRTALRAVLVKAAGQRSAKAGARSPKMGMREATQAGSAGG